MQHIQESIVAFLHPDYSFSRIKSVFSITESYSARQYSSYGTRKSVNGKKFDLEVKLRRAMHVGYSCRTFNTGRRMTELLVLGSRNIPPFEPPTLFRRLAPRRLPSQARAMRIAEVSQSCPSILPKRRRRNQRIVGS